MVVVIDGPALLRDLAADFREFFLLFFLLLFLFAGISSLETSDVKFVHLQHGFHHALGAGGIGIGQHLAESFWDDLPGEAEPIGEPATAAGLSAVAELAPQVIDFLLRLAVYK